ncbi:two-component regulator propeller domain-containing protein [uncultured Bacteroides sp.]|uniref:hybrid sensor histidine kinase/response regulator transcription factor n=1 Tax=uncultured Bacteroides sp. TaxID=162156 RepID=UPI002AAB5244|nr:two-component regulator propeller domain-containing protein [uncultured Bacteroides sp.]
MKRHILLFLLFFYTILGSFASIEIRSKQINTSNGLANNSVRYILQDSKGFMWLGTLNGLCRYDGNSFITFKPQFGNNLSLADHRIYDLEEDKNGFLWVNTSAELYSCYDLKHDRFVDFTGNAELRNNYSKKIIAKNGNVWLWNSGNGCRQVKYEDGSFSSVNYTKKNRTLSSDLVVFVSEDSKGIIWVGTQHGLTRIFNGTSSIVDNQRNFFKSVFYNGQTYFVTNQNEVFWYNPVAHKLQIMASLPGMVQRATPTGCLLLKDEWVIFTDQGTYIYNFRSKSLIKDNSLFHEAILSGSTITDNKGDCWIFNHTGKLWYINVRTKKTKSFQLIPSDKISYIDNERYHIVHDSRNIIWISTYGNGLFAYDIAKDELEHYTSNINGFSHISSDYLQFVTEDKSGEIWVCSEFAGISKITVLNESSSRIYPEDKSLSDRSNTVRMISKMANGDIWIGTRKGCVYVYDSELNKKPVKYDFHSNIYAAVEDDKGKVWIGSRGDGLCIDNVWYKNDLKDPNSISENNVFSILRDSKNRMWIATFGSGIGGGLDLAVFKNGKYIFKHFFNKSYGQKQVRVLLQDKNGMIWIGTSDGVYVFNPDLLIKNPKNYYVFNYNNGKLKSNEIRAIMQDKNGRIWIGTSGAGFSSCELKKDYSTITFQHYNIQNGLVNDVVQSINEDKSGNLWIATEYGMSKFYPKTKIFENYFFSSYALGNVYSENSTSKCKDGKLIFGTNYGLIMFDSKKVKRSFFSSPAVFTSLKINGINVSPEDPDSPLEQSISYSDKITLKHSQNSFVLDFSSFNFYESELTKYSYKLENYDKEWSVPTSLNFAAYKNLPSGEYLLKVRVCNGSGVWDYRVTALKIVVKPPFWLTIWAFMIYALVLGVTLYFAFKITRDFTRLHNKIQVEKQLTDYKLVFFTNISHEFRTPLTLIKGALERIQRIDNAPKEFVHPLQTMEKSTNRMIRLIDQLLEFRKMQNNKLALSLEKTDVIAFIYEIFLSFSDTSESKDIDFQFTPSINSYKAFIDKGKLDKIVYNLLSNAFKYTPSSGKVSLIVNVDAEKDVLLIQVKDTGVGIPKEKREELFKRFMQSNFSGNSVGIGLHLVNELVGVHKGKIWYNENEGGGSVFSVSLPLDESVYGEKDFLIPNNILMKEEQSMNNIKMTVPESQEMEDVVPLNNYKILIIEDDNDVRQFLKEEIGVYFEVRTAEDGLDGLEKIKDYDADLIVCDVLMPGMNGYEVTRKLKDDFQTSHIPVILLTALGTTENHLEGIESGADAYITKPFSVKLLLARIIKLIEQREKLRTKFSSEPGINRPAICSTDKDKGFIDKLHEILETEIANAEFSVDDFAAQMGLGRTVFYKKVKGVTGHSPNEYLRIIRMKKAAELLLSTSLTVSEVSYKVGINDPFYFSKCFKSQFGVAPSVYQKQDEIKK